MDIIKKHLRKLEKKELKILNKKQGIMGEKIEPIVNKVESKIPDSLKNTLDAAFYKSFKLIFKNGTKYIEKLYNKNKIQFNHNIHDYNLKKNSNSRSIRRIDGHSKKSTMLNASISTLEGAGLGLLGMGIPDIPLFSAMILKTVYEISLSYGFLYELEEEKIYILNIINASLTNGERQSKYNRRVDLISDKIDNHIMFKYDLNKEILNTSKILSDSMLTAKFIQGIPVVGVVGSIYNYSIINKISGYCLIKYKKRYLKNNKK
ncbi:MULTISPECIES: EcsC family protein [unclassified Sedimentibacter]|uniref:EcsC family protein n=1 Tax=unclassified Sedimentibacter TaxID=2649220 RepID=UPI0027E01374|nr:EcsC family protein [Sedimentibacter sp. MB35-C1]WMJ78916.1 EcsC family protein [Sedimentibacter sp. MB35-C1]